MINEPTNVCVVTGGTRGIGLATAIRFAQEGFHVAVCGRDADRLQSARQIIGQAAVEGTSVETVIADLQEKKSPGLLIDQVMQRFGRIDVLVNNAAMAPLSPLDEMGDDQFEAVINLNMAGVFRTTRAVWPIMKAQRGGIVVNISSQAAVDPFPGFCAYGSSKAWVELFTKALAKEGRDSQIRTYGIRPGAVETSMLRNLFPDFPPAQTVSPEEVAECVWSVCQIGFANSSGQIISVSRQ